MSRAQAGKLELVRPAPASLTGWVHGRLAQRDANLICDGERCPGEGRGAG